MKIATKTKGQSVSFNRRVTGHTQEMAKMFYAFSNTTCFDDNMQHVRFDKDVKPIVEVLSIGANRKFDISYYDNTKRFKTCGVEEKGNVVVCFSGGKDSTAAAIKMKEVGLNVHLFYVQGINKSYPDEMEKAKAIANYLHMPLHIETISLKGKTDFHDNPVKNQLIASMALDYGITNGIGTKVCFGDFYTDVAKESSFLEAWSDCIEMWNAHRDFVRLYVPQYEIIIPFKNYIETMDIISKDSVIMEMVQGCVLPQRFRKSMKTNNEKRYGVNLLPNRCGSCWKCCAEYIHYADIGVVEYNKDFYQHCLVFLSGKMHVLHKNVGKVDLESTYRSFLYNDYKNSKFYNDDSK